MFSSFISISHLGSPARTLLDDNRVVDRRKFRGERPGDTIERYFKLTEKVDI